MSSMPVRIGAHAGVDALDAGSEHLELALDVGAERRPRRSASAIGSRAHGSCRQRRASSASDRRDAARRGRSRICRCGRRARRGRRGARRRCGVRRVRRFDDEASESSAVARRRRRRSVETSAGRIRESRRSRRRPRPVRAGRARRASAGDLGAQRRRCRRRRAGLRRPSDSRARTRRPRPAGAARTAPDEPDHVGLELAETVGDAGRSEHLGRGRRRRRAASTSATSESMARRASRTSSQSAPTTSPEATSMSVSRSSSSRPGTAPVSFAEVSRMASTLARSSAISPHDSAATLPLLPSSRSMRDTGRGGRTVERCRAGDELGAEVGRQPAHLFGGGSSSIAAWTVSKRPRAPARDRPRPASARRSSMPASAIEQAFVVGWRRRGVPRSGRPPSRSGASVAWSASSASGRPRARSRTASSWSSGRWPATRRCARRPVAELVERLGEEPAQALLGLEDAAHLGEHATRRVVGRLAVGEHRVDAGADPLQDLSDVVRPRRSSAMVRSLARRYSSRSDAWVRVSLVTRSAYSVRRSVSADR